jgi:hypothetical protein
MFRADAVFPSGNRTLVPRVCCAAQKPETPLGNAQVGSGPWNRSLAQETNTGIPRSAMPCVSLNRQVTEMRRRLGSDESG